MAVTSGTGVALLVTGGKIIPREASMQKRIILFFDIAVLTGFGVYLAMTIWHLPDALRQKLLATSLGMLAKLTGFSG